MDLTLCKHEVCTVPSLPQSVRRTRGNTGHMGGSAESGWHKSRQKLHGHTGFGCAKLLTYFQSRRMHLNWKDRHAGLPYGSIVHTLTPSIQWVFWVQDRLLRHCLQEVQGLRLLFPRFHFLGKCHQPCRNGGKCTGRNKCKCSKGYQGDLCSKRKYQSHSINPCGTDQAGWAVSLYKMSALTVVKVFH